jgi:membrane protease YdiL (CAAX protease family)
VLLSSALFAISHVHPWSALSTFFSGLLLGAVRIGSGSIGLCIALHAGYNLATLVCGLPPERFALSPAWSSAVGWGALGVAVWLARRAGEGAPVWIRRVQ